MNYRSAHTALVTVGCRMPFNSVGINKHVQAKHLQPQFNIFLFDRSTIILIVKFDCSVYVWVKVNRYDIDLLKTVEAHFISADLFNWFNELSLYKIKMCIVWCNDSAKLFVGLV